MIFPTKTQVVTFGIYKKLLFKPIVLRSPKGVSKDAFVEGTADAD